MKPTVKTALFVLTLLFCISVEIQAGDLLPSLRGMEAVEKLKENGQYDSLINAVKAARKEPVTDPETQDAVGQTTRFTAADGSTGDQFGYSVAISGDTAIIGAFGDDVGANLNQGSAYIFIRNGTTWMIQQKITAADGATDDSFGYSVSISGDTAVIGAYLDDVGANQDCGSSYVFVRSGTSWTQQQKLTASNGAALDQFGYGVAVSGDTAIIGAFGDDVGANLNQGSAYIFVRSGVTWTEQQQLTVSNGAADDHFGDSVAVSGNTAIVGAYLDDVGANINQGSAYVFTRSGTIWTQQQQLNGTGGASADQFGISVAISGETVIVGANLDDVGGNNDQGSAYIFVRSGMTWTQQQQLTAAGGAASDQFGISVSISNNIAVAGSIGDDTGTNTDQGAAYVFVYNGTLWNQQKLTAADGTTNDSFGIGVAISGSNLIVGANFDDVGANQDQGAAYNFRVLSTNWTQETQKVAPDGLANDNFGYGVAISGDTAVVSAIFDDLGAGVSGSAYVFVRSGTNWIFQQKLVASDGGLDDRFGLSVAIYGDTVIIASIFSDIGANTNQGAAYVFVRSGTIWTEQQKLIASDGEALDNFGFTVALEGDTAVVGAFADNVGMNAVQGSAYVFVRSGTVWTEQQKLTASDGAANDIFGSGVGVSGDTVVVGAYGDDIGANMNQGSAYVFVRSGTTWTEQQKLTGSVGSAGNEFGASTAILEDTIVVGTRNSAYIFVRSGTNWTEQQRLSAPSSEFGNSVAISGDTIVVGAISDNVGGNANQGSAYVFARSGTTWTQQQKLTATNGAANDGFGNTVGISGDKIIVGAPFSDVSVSIPRTSNKSNNFIPQATDQGAMFIFINSSLIPTAANISISGRILTANGAGLRNATVSLLKPNGEIITMNSSSFGYYDFEELEAGQTYVITVNSKQYTFAPRIVNANDDLTEVNLIAQQ